MLGFLLAGGGPRVEDSLEEVTPIVTKVATPTATVVYDGLIKQTGIQWGTVVLYAIYLIGALLLAYIVYNVVKAIKSSKK